MAAVVVCILCALILIKPQEFVPALEGLPVTYIAFGAALLATAAALVSRRVRPALAPQLPLLGAFFLWALFVTLVKRSDALDKAAMSFAILATIVLLLAVAAASRSGLRVFGLMFLTCSALVTTVAIMQSYAPLGCFLAAPRDRDGGEQSYDGRPCETMHDCTKNAPVPGGEYRCEHVGPLSTSSVGGRVRYRGSLADPNELSLTISIAMPFAIALAEVVQSKRRNTARAAKSSVAALWAIPVMGAVAAVGFTVVAAQSRSGLIVFLMVLGIYFVRRVGAWGVVMGCLFAPPMLMLGGRSGAEADSSSDERAELLREAFEFIRGTKGFGLGVMQFPEESSIGLTAHNAYLLAAAETGLVGMILFGLAMYLTIKVPLALWFGDYQLSAPVARFAPALAIALAGASIGIFFLSWTYKDILYILIGASAALYGAARADDPKVRVTLSWREALTVAGTMVCGLVGLYVVLRTQR